MSEDRFDILRMSLVVEDQDPSRLVLELPFDEDLDVKLDLLRRAAAPVGLLGAGRDLPGKKVTITAEVIE